MRSNTAPALSQPNSDDPTPVPPSGRIAGSQVHAAKLIQLTQPIIRGNARSR